MVSVPSANQPTTNTGTMTSDETQPSTPARTSNMEAAKRNAAASFVHSHAHITGGTWGCSSGTAHRVYSEV